MHLSFVKNTDFFYDSTANIRHCTNGANVKLFPTRYEILNSQPQYIHMHWILLIIAGLFEVGFTTCLGKANESQGAAFIAWIIGFFISLSISMLLLYKATTGMGAVPLGSGYAVWTGIGAVGTVLVGIFFFQEPVSFWRIFFIFTLIGSVVGLKLVSH